MHFCGGADSVTSLVWLFQSSEVGAEETDNVISDLVAMHQDYFWLYLCIRVT